MENHVRKRKLTSSDLEGLQDESATDYLNGLIASKENIDNSSTLTADENPTNCSELINGIECRPLPRLRPTSTITFDDKSLQGRPISENNQQINKEVGFIREGVRDNLGRDEGICSLDINQDKEAKIQDQGDNECDPPELSFREVPETPSSRRKVREIEDVLSQQPVNVKKLKKLAISEGGLINDDLRKRAWSKLIGIDNIPPLSPLSDEDLEANGEYSQVVLDVNRSLKRFPPGIPYDQRVVLQDQLTRLIMRVIIKHPHLRYYQGYHDVAVTVLLVVGEEAAFPIMEKLSTGHLNECMAETMDSTSHLLNYIYPLMKRMHSKLYDFMERSGCGTLFCLPWYLTWFGHNLNHYTDVVRLYDYFMSCEKLLPLYLAAAIVVHRKDEIFNVECDMPYVHSLLSNIPDDLPFENLLKEATQLYKKYPPSSIETEVNERTRLSRIQMRGDDEKAVSRRAPLRSILQLMPRYSLFLATATLVVGLYAYIRTASAMDPDALFPFR